MANPLARMVMNNVAQKSGKVEKRSSKASVSNTVSTTNLGKRETQLLSSLLNSKAKTKTTGNSYNKSTYGRSSNISNVKTNTMQTLSSLVPGQANKSEKPTTKVNTKTSSCAIDKSRQSLKSLCSLDNISIGRPNVSNESKVSGGANVNKLNLSDLVKGNSKSSTTSTVRPEVRTSNIQSKSGMTTLGNLAGKKTKNTSKSEDNKAKANTNNTYVKTGVINNLEAYIPKVTLESIGKKGSLF